MILSIMAIVFGQCFLTLASNHFIFPIFQFAIVFKRSITENMGYILKIIFNFLSYICSYTYIHIYTIHPCLQCSAIFNFFSQNSYNINIYFSVYSSLNGDLPMTIRTGVTNTWFSLLCYVPSFRFTSKKRLGGHRTYTISNV